MTQSVCWDRSLSHYYSHHQCALTPIHLSHAHSHSLSFFLSLSHIHTLTLSSLSTIVFNLKLPATQKVGVFFCFINSCELHLAVLSFLKRFYLKPYLTGKHCCRVLHKRSPHPPKKQNKQTPHPNCEAWRWQHHDLVLLWCIGSRMACHY